MMAHQINQQFILATTYMKRYQCPTAWDVEESGKKKGRFRCMRRRAKGWIRVCIFFTFSFNSFQFPCLNSEVLSLETLQVWCSGALSLSLSLSALSVEKIAFQSTNITSIHPAIQAPDGEPIAWKLLLTSDPSRWGKLLLLFFCFYNEF